MRRLFTRGIQFPDLARDSTFLDLNVTMPDVYPQIIRNELDRFFLKSCIDLVLKEGNSSPIAEKLPDARIWIVLDVDDAGVSDNAGMVPEVYLPYYTLGGYHDKQMEWLENKIKETLEKYLGQRDENGSSNQTSIEDTQKRLLKELFKELSGREPRIATGTDDLDELLHPYSGEEMIARRWFEVPEINKLLQYRALVTAILSLPISQNEKE